MKAKVKFDKNQLKPLLIKHVEKIVFAGMALVALLLCWSAIGLSPYQGVPEQLSQKANDVKTRVANSKPPEKFDDLPAQRNLNGMLHNALVAVNPALFPMTEMLRPYSDHKVRRQQPALLAVQDPRATAGFGAIAMSKTALGIDRLIAGRNPARAPISDMAMEGGPMGMMPDMMGQPGMMPGAEGGSGMPPGYDPGQMMQGMAGGPGGGGMPEDYDPTAMMQGMQGGMMPGMMPGMGGNARGKKKPKKPAPKPKAKPVIEVVKPDLEVPTNATLEGRYWVTVTGLIPSWDQEAEFQKVFRDATRTYRTDTPEYLFSDIERAEVTSSGELGEYEALDMEAVVKDMEKWAGVYPEKIDKKYLTPSPDVTEPLPPLVLANHDLNAIRHPKIPLAGEASAEENKAAAAAAAEVKDEEAEGDPKSRRRRGGRGRGAGPRGMPGMMSMGGTMGGGTAAAKEKIEHMLFRFFDFTVQPGKKYKYRIRLALENPNYKVPPQFLKSPDLAKEELIFTDWSEPTPEVFVPLGSELLAGDINPKDPSAKILVRQFDKDKALTAVHVFEVPRGGTLNANGIEVSKPKTTNAVTPTGAPEEEKPKVDFRTDATMVDLVGGDKLVGGPSGVKSPGRMLVMRSDGELTMLSEFSDAERYEKEDFLLNEAKDADKPKTPGAAASEAGAEMAPGSQGNPFSDIFNNGGESAPQRGRRKK